MFDRAILAILTVLVLSEVKGTLKSVKEHVKSVLGKDSISCTPNVKRGGLVFPP